MFTVLIATVIFAVNYLLLGADLGTALNTSFWFGYWWAIVLSVLLGIILMFGWLASVASADAKNLTIITIAGPIGLIFLAISIAGWYLMMNAVPPGTATTEWDMPRLIVGAVLVLLMALFARNSSSSSKKMTSGC
jgi:hypothetical protein